MIHIGIDDTDSLVGMCTTYLAVELVRDLGVAGFGLVGPPRLVRLNPMIELKTRGNAAVSLRVAKGASGKRWCGEFEGREVTCARTSLGTPSGDELDEVESIVVRLLDRRADVVHGANPGYVVSRRAPPAALYHQAVTRFVKMEEALASLPQGARHGGSNGALGVVGAAAATAWPARRKTWEIITFRNEKRWGLPREVDARSARRLKGRFPETFNNYDEDEERMLITPRSPCPVLFGIRAVRPQRLLEAARSIRPGEDWGSSLLFVTNQATGDHISRTGPANIGPGTCVETRGAVATVPRAIRGGAVIFTLASGAARIDCAAYEPTRDFRRLVSSLLPGDRVIVRGGVRDRPRGINLESIDVLSIVREELRNPVCPDCERSMESAGRGQGFRCVRCGAKRPRKLLFRLERLIRPGRYQVPPCAMRHLHRPLGLRLQ